MFKKRILMITIILTSMLLSGCWDRMELNELSITSASSMDINKEGILSIYFSPFPKIINLIVILA